MQSFKTNLKIVKRISWVYIINLQYLRPHHKNLIVVQLQQQQHFCNLPYQLVSMQYLQKNTSNITVNTEYLSCVIVRVRVVFRKTVVDDWRFDYLSSSHLQSQVNTALVVETSVTNNSHSKDYPHPDDHAKQITDTHGFKPFTMLIRS